MPRALEIVDGLVAQAPPDAADVLDLRAIVLAEDGRFEEAIETQQRAIQSAGPAASQQQLREYHGRLALYQAGQRVSDQRRR